MLTLNRRSEECKADKLFDFYRSAHGASGHSSYIDKPGSPVSELLFKPIYPVSFVGIYMIFASQIAAEREKELQKQEEEKQQANIALKKAKEEQAPKTFKAGVGKYINPATM